MKQKKIQYQIFMIIALVLFFFDYGKVFACVASRDPRYNYFISYESPYAGLFKDGADEGEMRPTVVDRCQESAGQFLMVSLALRTPRINGRTADISFTKKLLDDSCKIANNPFPIEQTYIDRISNFEKQFDLLRVCTYYDISEINGNVLETPDLQPAAQLERIDQHHIRAYGDFVFLKVSRNSRFAIGVGLKKECTDRSFLTAHHLEPTEIQALLNTYVTGDSTGNSTNLMPIGSTRIRLALTSGSELMPVGSFDRRVDSPSLPTTFQAGIEFGSLTISSQKDSRFKLDFSLMVDQFSNPRCVLGLCSVANSYSVPIAGLIELVDLDRSRNRVVDSWYFGASAPGQYQGFIESATRYIDPALMSEGRHYAIEMTMVDPEEDYSLFLSNVPQLLINLSSKSGVAGADQIQTLGQLSELTGLSLIKGFGALSGADWKQQIEVAIAELSKMRAVRNWPAYFEKTCLGKSGICFKRGQVKFYKKIGAKFKLGKIRDDETRELEKIVLFHSDPLNGYQEIEKPRMPFIDCSNLVNP